MKDAAQNFAEDAAEDVPQNVVLGLRGGGVVPEPGIFRAESLLGKPAVLVPV